MGLNAHRVFHNNEWRRLGTSLAVHADLPHLVSNSAALVLEVRPCWSCMLFSAGVLAVLGWWPDRNGCAAELPPNPLCRAAAHASFHLLPTVAAAGP